MKQEERIMNKELNNLLEANSYNITDQAGNKLTVIDIEDAKRIIIEFAKKEAIEAFKAGKQAGVDEGNTEGSKFSQSVDEYLKERFDGDIPD